ncbi:MAG: class I SAM-dependent methyltransferase [Chloroflexi bacterium]|nr:class I SAM-dependent methyltransferase [Chloroflexota bacterium]
MLDIGCDLGDMFHWFPDPGWTRHGVEISPSAAKYAAQTHSAQVYSGTIREAGFPDTLFDLVTMLDMLYYVDDPSMTIKEVARILKPGGICAVEISGQSYQLMRSRGLLCWLIEQRWTRLHTDSSYLFWFTPTSLQRLLEDSGLRIIEEHVIDSPTSSVPWRDQLAGSYSALIRRTSRLSRYWLTWTPKYMLLAERVEKI